MCAKFDDPVDKEEHLFFDNTIQWLNDLIKESKNDGLEYLKVIETKGYSANNKDDIQPIRENRGYAMLSNRSLERYEAALTDPYFMHLEFSQLDCSTKKSEEENIYIGRSMLSDNRSSEIKVYSWTSDLANELYYKKRKNKFTLNIHDEKLKSTYSYQITPLLRRAIKINKGQYEGYINEFVSKKYIEKYGLKNIEAGEQIVDSFLLDIIAQKKKENRITDIIRTIQTNQNNVIRLPHDKSFIVQGCAGSGKTMIMLHRLSYLFERKFLNQDIETIIITPSDNFNAQIKELVYDLNIENVKLSTLNAYYAQTLKNYGWSASATGNDTVDNEDFLNFIYSPDFLIIMQEIYDQNRKAGIETPNMLDANFISCALCKVNNVPNNKYNDIFSLKSQDEVLYYLDKILTINKENENKIKQATDNFKKTEEKFIKKRKEYINTQNMLKDTVSGIKQCLYSIKEQLSIKINNVKNTKKINNLQNKINTVDEFIKDFDVNINNSANSDFIKKIYNFTGDKAIYEKLKQYNHLTMSSKTIEISLKNFKKIAKHEKQIIEDTSYLLLNETELKKINIYIDEMKKSTAYKDYKKLFEDKIVSVVNDECKKYNIIYRKYSKYMNYLRLWWYYINHRPSRKEKIMFCIDEAQNISLTEYRLIQILNGENTIFNLYGDVYQNTYCNFGIKDWSSIGKTLKHEIEIFNFQENYRNTAEITDYTNSTSKLPIKMIPIGTNGMTPQEILRESFVRTVESIPNDVKICVIFKQSLLKEIKTLLSQVKKTTNVYYLNLEESRGLEFNTVFVFEKHMNSNEKYIAYTRAMENLFIVL